MRHDHTTTIRLPKDFHKKVRKKAIDEGRPLSAVIRELLKEWLEENDEKDTVE